MIYRHYRGSLYRVLFNASEATSSRIGKGTGYGAVVVYVSLDTGAIHVRDAEEFHGEVSIDGKTAKRFGEVKS